MLILNNISFEFGSRYLYKDTSWHIKPNEKIGLIGANGTGKSTLLRIIVGEYKVSSGNITKRKDLVLGFLNQDLLSYQTSDSILQVALEAFQKQNLLHNEIEEILERLNHDHSENLLHKLTEKQHEYEALDGYNIQYKAEEILEGLGFSTNDLQRSLREFSGGWRMRVMLAKILLQKPDLLLLDEPTNHLDLPSIKWLENYLLSYPGTVVIVSHDRYFLDRVVNKIVEISNEKLTSYTGNYTQYVLEKSEREELQKSQFKNQEKYIKQQERLIERFRAKATKAKMVQSRIKALEKLDRVSDVEESNKTLRINFNLAQQTGRAVVDLDIKLKKYPSCELFVNTSAQIERGDKIALIGANGRGKSTLLRIIDGSENFDGKAQLGFNVSKSFFAQHQIEALNLNNGVLQELQMLAPDQDDTTLRGLLGAFLFSGDDVFKKIKVLSGGEKSRVALAKTVLSKANFLILDEPTNHLDIQSSNILIEVLKQYKGTFIVVSHDRYFLSEIANKIWWIEDKKIKEYPGKYEEYESWVEEKKAEQNNKNSLKAEKIKKEKKVVLAENPDAERKKQYKKILSNFNSLETKIARLKKEKEDLEQQLSLAENYGDNIKINSLSEEYTHIDDDLSQSLKEWEELFQQISEFEKL